MLNSTSLKPIEGVGGVLRPTAAERAAGRFMRAPDHDAGTADAGTDTASGGEGGDAGAASGGEYSGADAGGETGVADDSSILGSATTDTGAGDKASEGGEGEKAPAADHQPDVPEAYELKPFTIGEGDGAQTVQIDTSLLETVTPGLKEAGVTQAQLDKLAPAVVPAIQEQAIKQLNDEFATTRADWVKQAKADPETGGKNWNDTVRLAAKALDHFGARSERDKDGNETNEFRKLLNDSGLGNHPVMIRFMRGVGAALSEDGAFIRNTSETAKPLSRDQRMYPNDQPKTSN